MKIYKIITPALSFIFLLLSLNFLFSFGYKLGHFDGYIKGSNDTLEDYYNCSKEFGDSTGFVDSCMIIKNLLKVIKK